MKPTQLNNEQLIALCITGDESAQLEIYNRYYNAMYNVSFRIVKNSFEAEDIMQDSFLVAFTKLKTLKDPRIFGSWLKRIVINNSIHHYHKISKTNNVPIDDKLYIVESNTPTYESDEHCKNIAKQVLKTMQQLKDNYRIALTLNLIEGYDYDEISEILNISNANCRTIISRAKAQFRQKFEMIYETKNRIRNE